MAWSSTFDERYAGGYLSYSADTYDASNLLNSTFTLVDGQTAYGNLTDAYTTADQDVYSLGILSTGYYTLDVDSYTWDWSSYGYGSVSRFELLNSYGGVVDTSYSVYSDITFTVTTSDTYYAKIIGPSYSEEQYSIKYTKTGELLGDTTAPILTSFSLPTTVDLASGEGELIISASAFDAGSGVDQVVVYFDQNVERAYSSGGSPSTFSVAGLYGSGDSWVDGSSREDWFLTKTNDLGTYKVAYVVAKDEAGNERTYYASTLSSLGYNTEFELINSAQTNYKDLYTSFSLTNDDVVDGMTQGSKWSSKVTKPLKFAISDGPANEYWYNPILVADTVKLVFQNLESYINISTEYVGKFNNPTEAANADATIVVSLAGESMFGSSKTTWAMGHFPDASDTSSKGGDIFLNINSPANSLPSYEKGSQGYFLLLHELGHTLGLKHPHDDGGNGRPTFSQIGFGRVDFDSFTIMSYEDQIGYDQKKYDPGTPMILDVIALQYLYGINNTYNSTNTVIELSADGIYKTVWDAGGSDTVTVSDEKTAWNIVLPYYKISTLSDELTGWAESFGNDANSNANSTLIWLLGDIENVTGGAGNDIISGNSENNILVGAAGNDIIYCGKGDDTLTGGLGSDEFIFYWGDGSNIITDFDLTLDTCTFIDTSGNKLTYTESTNSKNEVEYSLSDGTSVTLQGIYGEQTYIIPSSGLSINHTGAGAIINAPYNLSLYDEGIFVTNTGTGSTTITATGTVKGGVGQTDQTANSDGIYAWNGATTKDLSITAKDVNGLDDGILGLNNGTGAVSIELSGDVNVTSTELNTASKTSGYIDDSHHYGIGVLNYGTNIDIATTGDVTSADRGIYAVNYGSGSTTISSSGSVKASFNQSDETYNQAGIEAYNASSTTDIKITAKNVEALTHGIFAKNLGSGTTEISVSGNIVGHGSGAEGIHTFGSGATVTVLTTASVRGTAEGIETDSKADTVTVKGSVTGLNGTAILLGGGNDTVNLGATAKITGTIDGGTGSDTASFSISKSAVDSFTYDDTTKTAVVTVDSTVTTLKDFEYFKFSDDTSAMTTAAAVTTLTKVILTESIGALSVVNSGTSTAPVLDFYLDSSKDPGDAGVTSIDVVLKFDPTHASFTSFSFDSGLLGAANEASAADGTITFGAIALTPVSTDKPLFTMTMEDLDSTNDFAVTVSDLNIDGSVLEGSTLVVGSPSSHAVTTSVVTRDGSKIADADVVMSDGTNSSSYKSTADGSVSGSLTSGSASTVTGSLAYSNSTKAVSSQDALDALKLSVGMTTAAGTKTAFDFISADFNQDGKVSSQDALSILKYSVGLTTPEQAKWVFVDTGGDYSGVSKSNTSYTDGVSIAELSADISVSLTGILIGDVNDSYSGLIA
jgi:hypothetical protein